MRNSIRVRKSAMAAVAVAAGLTLALTGCEGGGKKSRGSDDDTTGGSSSSGGVGVGGSKKNEKVSVTLEIKGEGKATIRYDLDYSEARNVHVTLPWKHTESMRVTDTMRQVGTTVYLSATKPEETTAADMFPACAITVDAEAPVEDPGSAGGCEYTFHE